tara:strand:- start:163 stop:453 length:291 start_codon:yes stop_codon:yes gene_type:complete
MSNIPLARQILQSATTMGDIRDMRVAIETALKHMTREPFTRKSSVKSPHMTKDLISRIRRYSERNPDLPLQEIAQAIGVNAGRVSEVLAGKHDDKL